VAPEPAVTGPETSNCATQSTEAALKNPRRSKRLNVFMLASLHTVTAVLVYRDSVAMYLWREIVAYANAEGDRRLRRE